MNHLNRKEQLERMEMAVAQWRRGREIKAVADKLGMRPDNLRAALIGRGLVEPRAGGARIVRQDTERRPVLIDEALRVSGDREPCWRCGTRGDIGCAHQRPAR